MVSPQEVRNFINRRNGVMKKANVLYRKHNARVAVLFEWNGATYCYQSDAGWPLLQDLRVLPANTFSPDNFETVADRSATPNELGCSNDLSNKMCRRDAAGLAGPELINTIETPPIQSSEPSIAMDPDAPGEDDSFELMGMVDAELQSRIRALEDSETPSWTPFGTPMGSQGGSSTLSSFTSATSMSPGILSLSSTSSSSSGSSIYEPGTPEQLGGGKKKVGSSHRAPRRRTPLRKCNTYQRGKQYF